MKEIRGRAVLILLTLGLCCFSGGFLAGNSCNRTQVHISTANYVAPADAATVQRDAPIAADALAEFPVNINTADLETLTLLPGIGETYAQRIIAYREQHGAFTEIEKLMEVSGIGAGRFDAIRDYITVGAVSPEEGKEEHPEARDFPININTADLESLMRLPGIGETCARQIIAHREKHGAFTDIEELLEISGIGAGRFDTIKDLITVEDTNEDTGRR